jgi:hypothetical protein
MKRRRREPLDRSEGPEGVRQSSRPSRENASRPTSGKRMKTSLPSEVGVGVVGPWRGWKTSARAFARLRRHSNCPVRASWQSTRRSSPSWPVRTMRSPTTIGEELPFGDFTDQSTFPSGERSAGSPTSSETPVPFGPLNLDQSEPLAVSARSRRARAAQRVARARQACGGAMVRLLRPCPRGSSHARGEVAASLRIEAIDRPSSNGTVATPGK